MKIELDLPEYLVTRVTTRARQLEMTLDQYVAGVLEQADRTSVNVHLPREATLAEIEQVMNGTKELMHEAVTQRKLSKNRFEQLALDAVAKLLAGPVGVPTTLEQLVGEDVWATITYPQRIGLGAFAKIHMQKEDRVEVGERIDNQRSYTLLPEPVPMPRGGPSY